MRVLTSVLRALLGILLSCLLLLGPAVALADDSSPTSSEIQVDVPAAVQLEAPSDVMLQVEPGVEVAGVQVGVHCASWGGAACVIADSVFDADVRALGSTSVGQSLLASASRAGVTLIVLAPATPSANATATMGAFVPAQNSVRIAAAVQTYPQPDRLAVLTHELQHAVDAANGLAITTTAGCYSTEENAVTSEVRLWRELFDGGALPAPRTPYEAWLNAAARSTSLTDVIHNAYRGECGAVLPGA